eukprot:TRINITY_DN1384_c0_g2_i1.p1 TRINITY_DN1384_c0_g2~~TRINITY_DN1384_c0_g2_i1.p1  ORF type:complete len:1138 (-),score=443.59 TRINITY_DN1384_c0_g2_i1:824-4237(-)
MSTHGGGRRGGGGGRRGGGGTSSTRNNNNPSGGKSNGTGGGGGHSNSGPGGSGRRRRNKGGDGDGDGGSGGGGGGGGDGKKGLSKADVERKKRREAEAQKKKEDEEAAAKIKEEEEKEAKRKRKEEEKLKKQEMNEEEKKRQKEQGMKDLKMETEARIKLRECNLAAETSRPPTAHFKKLDSSIKRNSAFTRRLRQLSQDHREAILKDARAVNCRRYISEDAAAMAEAKIKTTDISAFVEIASVLHQSYDEVAQLIVDALVKVFAKSDEELSTQERALLVTKQRINLRLLAAMYICGLIEDADVILKYLVVPMRASLEKEQGHYESLALVASFTRYASGEPLLGLFPSSREVLEEIEMPDTETVLSEESLARFNSALKMYFEKVSNYIVKHHKKLETLRKKEFDMLMTRGDAPPSLTEQIKEMFEDKEKLMALARTYATHVSFELPELVEEEFQMKQSVSRVDFRGMHGDEKDLGPFDDEDTRSFYEDIPDLRQLVPGVLLGVKQAAKAPKPDDEDDDGDAADADGKDASDEKKDETTNDDNSKEDNEDDDDEEEEKTTGTSASLATVLIKLPQCSNHDQADKLALDFCYVNSRKARKKLVDNIYSLRRSECVQIPCFGRVVATLSNCIDEIGPPLVEMLEGEFHTMWKKKKQSGLEYRLLNARFLSELCKFGVCPPNVIFKCIKKCLDEFVHHNIDVCCQIFEACGRFLYRSPDTHVRTTNMLEILMRLKMVKNLDNRRDTMVENAFYYCNPPEHPAIVQKEYTPMEKYIRHLVMATLSQDTVKDVLKKLRRIDWDEHETFVRHTLLKAARIKYTTMALVASLVSGLANYNDTLTIGLVDDLLENIRDGLETPDFTKHQHHILNMKFLGELYNYTMVGSQVIFDMLYTLIFLGHGPPGSPPPPNDTPSDCFRVRLVCVLLNSCGQYFKKGAAGKRLDRFLVFFQRYYLSKMLAPLDLDFAVSDALERLRPDERRISSYKEAATRAADLEVDNSGAESVGKFLYDPTCIARGVRVDDDEDDGVDVEGEDDDDDDDDDEELVSKAEERGAGADADDAVSLRQPKMRATVQEDDEFEREFNKMMSDSVEARRLESRPSNNMAIPMALLRSRTLADSEAPAPAPIMTKGTPFNPAKMQFR